MPKRTDIKKIMVLGSGPIIIGQAAEFDYSGTQACMALREDRLIIRHHPLFRKTRGQSTEIASCFLFNYPTGKGV